MVSVLRISNDTNDLQLLRLLLLVNFDRIKMIYLISMLK